MLASPCVCECQGSTSHPHRHLSAQASFTASPAVSSVLRRAEQGEALTGSGVHFWVWPGQEGQQAHGPRAPKGLTLLHAVSVYGVGLSGASPWQQRSATGSTLSSQ